MLSTAVLLSLLIMTLVSAVFFHLGARMAKVAGATFGKALVTAILGGVLGALFQLVSSVIPGLGNVLGLILSLLITLFIVKSVYKTTLGKAFLVWLFGWIAALIALAILGALGLGALLVVV